MPGISDGSVIKGNEVTSTMLEWKNVPVVDYLQSKLKFRFALFRARALLQVEVGSPSPEQKYLLISCGLGIGAAFHIVGSPSRDDISPKVQISHVAVPGNDTICDCGQRGCLSKQGQELGL